MDKLMKQALEQNKIIRYIPTFIKVMETYKKLLEEHNEALRQCSVVGRSEQLPILDRCGCEEPNEEPIKVCMICNGYIE